MKTISALIISLVIFAGLGCKQEESRTAADAGAQTQAASSTRQSPASAISGPTCTREKPLPASPLRIAVIPKDVHHEFWRAVYAGALKAEVELKDVQVEWKASSTEDDPEQQIRILNEFVSAGVAGVVIAPLDDEALVRPVRDATKAGIAVVVLESGLKAEACKDFASLVAADNYIGGCKAADRLSEILQGKGKIIMLRYLEGSANTEQREQGFLDTIKKNSPNIEILSSDQYGGETLDSALAKAEHLLSDFKELDGVFTPNETTTSAMLTAIQEAGIEGDVKLVGFDVSDKHLQALQESHIHGLVVQQPMHMGYQAVKTVSAYLRGEAVPQKIDAGCVVVTPENMDEPDFDEILRPPVEEYVP